MTTTRRDFLRLAAAGTTLSFFSPSLFASSGSEAQRRVLVVLFLNGGNDALNTVVPYSDSRYRSLRPALAIPDADLLHLDDRNALHPALAPLEPMYGSRKLALVNGVGFPSLDRSHFHCRDVWMTAEAGDGGHAGMMDGGRGWLGRYADAYLSQTGSSLTTVSIGGQGSLALDAMTVLPATVPSSGAFDVATDPRAGSDLWGAGVRAAWGGARTAETLEAIREQGEETFGAIELFRTVAPPSTVVTYPDDSLGAAFRLAAQMIDGGTGTHAIWISHGGFDTHSAQQTEHEQLLGAVAGSLAAFQSDLSARGISDRAVVLAFSEFGRRAQENASRGTDHGKGGTVLLLGDRVNGGAVYGGAWDLGSLEDGDLAAPIDFRSVYSTLIRDWWGNDPVPVLGAAYENLGLIATGTPGRRRAIR